MFKRIPLPYDYAALEPYIDSATVETHYEKHHKTYTDKFNELLKKAPKMEGMSAEEILMNLDKAPAEVRTGLRNHGGGYYNHNLYFESLAPAGTKPSKELKKMADTAFGGYDAMLDKLVDAATVQLFGSGWTWLVLKDDKLSVEISANQDNPLQQGNPNILLPLDMWEHAYYLKYRNEKAKYAKEFFNIVNWDKVGERLEKSLSAKAMAH